MLNWLKNKIFIYVFAAKDYLDKSECEKYKNCVLLRKILAQQPPNSDRYLEYPWMMKNIKITKGRLLDIGSTACNMLYELLQKEIEIHGIDLNEKIIKDNKIKFTKGDIRKTDYPDDYFDCITCISTLEHIGVPGRYGSDDDSDGDIKAMREMKRILKNEGLLLVTIPYGIKDILPINKLYDKDRVKKLFTDYNIIEQKFLKFNKKFDFWFQVSEKEASKTDMFKDRWYAISFIKAIKK